MRLLYGVLECRESFVSVSSTTLLSVWVSASHKPGKANSFSEITPSTGGALTVIIWLCGVSSLKRASVMSCIVRCGFVETPFLVLFHLDCELRLHKECVGQIGTCKRTKKKEKRYSSIIPGGTKMTKSNSTTSTSEYCSTPPPDWVVILMAILATR